MGCELFNNINILWIKDVFSQKISSHGHRYMIDSFKYPVGSKSSSNTQCAICLVTYFIFRTHTCHAKLGSNRGK